MKKVIKIALFALCLIGAGTTIQAANEPAECAYCLDEFTLNNPAIAFHRPEGNQRAHVGCHPCTQRALARNAEHPECPDCRKLITAADIAFMNDPVAQQDVREQQKKLNEKNNAPKPAAKQAAGKHINLNIPALLFGLAEFLRWYAEQLAQII